MGGGIIRTAAKAAVSSFRSPIFDEAGRRIARQQVSSFAPAVEPGNFVPSLSAGHERADVAAVAVAAHWPEFEFDEWELAGGKEEKVESVNIAPRMIFGPVPTLEEAEEATTDLKDALEKVYLTPQHTLESDHEVCQEKHSGKCSTISSAPNHVLQMYSLLQTREAQVIVSSLASDKNVWDAVMNNEKVVQFFNNPSPAFAEIREQLAESVAERESTDEFSAKETSGNSFLKTVKIKISEMVSGISDFVKDFFGILTGDSSSSNDKSGSSSTDNTKAAVGASFFAVAVAAICVILLKRI